MNQKLTITLTSGPLIGAEKKTTEESSNTFFIMGKKKISETLQRQVMDMNSKLEACQKGKK